MKKLHLFMSDSRGKEEAQREDDLTPPTPTPRGGRGGLSRNPYSGTGPTPAQIFSFVSTGGLIQKDCWVLPFLIQDGAQGYVFLVGS